MTHHKFAELAAMVSRVAAIVVLLLASACAATGERDESISQTSTVTESVAEDGEEYQWESPERMPASTKRRAVKNGIEVMALDPAFPAENLRRSGYDVSRMRDHLDERETPDPTRRDRIFEQAGIQEEVQDWDHLDRDMLYLRARDHDLKKLSTRYPKIPASKLKQLKRFVGKETSR